MQIIKQHHAKNLVIADIDKPKSELKYGQTSQWDDAIFWVNTNKYMCALQAIVYQNEKESTAVSRKYEFIVSCEL